MKKKKAVIFFDLSVKIYINIFVIVINKKDINIISIEKNIILYFSLYI